jgi:signal transduction histidine kinase
LSRWIEEDLGERVTPEVAQMMDLLRGRVDRMERLIVGLLAYSRIGRTQDKVELVDVGAVLRDVVDLLGPPEGFRIEIAPDLPAVAGARVRLVQVFMNLIGNAVKHHHRKAGPAHVRVSWSDTGQGMYEFVVSDDGPGIDPRYHDRIFAIFQTLEARDKVEGAGIGLALVEKIVEGAGGTIRVESDVGRGCRFIFTWPGRTASEGPA